MRIQEFLSLRNVDNAEILRCTLAGGDLRSSSASLLVYCFIFFLLLV